MSQVTCSTGLEPGINDHGGDAEVVEAGSDCGGPDHGGQDVRPGGFRSQGPRLFHQPSPLLPTPCTSCNTLDGRWGTFSRLGVALWQSPRRRKRRLRVSWLLSLLLPESEPSDNYRFINKFGLRSRVGRLQERTTASSRLLSTLLLISCS